MVDPPAAGRAPASSTPEWRHGLLPLITLDGEWGGHFRVRPADAAYTSKQMYLRDTAVLVTRFVTAEGMGQVVDFMPPAGYTATDRHRMVRLIQCVRGRMTSEIEIAPRFDCGRHPHTLEVTGQGAVFTANGQRLTLRVVREPDDERLPPVTAVGTRRTASSRFPSARSDPWRRHRVGRRRTPAGDPPSTASATGTTAPPGSETRPSRCTPCSSSG